MLHNAIESFQDGRFAEAKSCCQQILADQPGNTDALHLMGVLEYKLGEMEQARETLGRVLAAEPKSAEVHYNLAKVLHDMGRLDEALLSYQQSVSINSELDYAHYNIGLIYVSRGETRKAATAFQQALRVNPNDSDYYFNLGNVYKELEEFDHAIECYQNAIELNPGAPEPYNNLGIIFKELGKYEQAITLYGRATEIRPNYPEAHYNTGNVYEEIGDLKAAANSYEQAIALKSDYSEAYNNLGNVYNLLGDREKAIAAYECSVKLDESCFLARHMLNSLTGMTSQAAPVEYVKNLFDKAACDFEQRLVQDLKYNSPAELKDILSALIAGNRRFENVVDLGCGTGLSGQAFHHRAKRMVGVDISAKMLEEAKGKNIYAELSEAGVLEFLEKTAEKYDLFVAADVLVYIGDLMSLFENIQECSMPGAYFLFSVEGLSEGSYSIRKTGRFAHSKAYILQLAEKNNFVVEACQPTVVRLENDQPIEGMNFALRRV